MRHEMLSSSVGCRRGLPLQELGVTQLWLPPPSNSVSKQGYLPGQLYDLDTPYGTKEELKGLLAQLKEAGIASLADIVINHRCADEQDEQGRWNKFACAPSLPPRPRFPPPLAPSHHVRSPAASPERTLAPQPCRRSEQPLLIIASDNWPVWPTQLITCAQRLMYAGHVELL